MSRVSGMMIQVLSHIGIGDCLLGYFAENYFGDMPISDKSRDTQKRRVGELEENPQITSYLQVQPW